MTNHLLAILGLGAICVLWGVIQRWRANQSKISDEQVSDCTSCRIYHGDTQSSPTFDEHNNCRMS